MIVLDGPVGTELSARGVATPAPAWSSAALGDAASERVLAAIHADYAAAGAVVHTACTFRAQPRVWPEGWRERLGRAVAIARAAVPTGHRVAGSLAPIEDCWRPDLSPPERVARPLHREVARALADAGVDLVLCEAFASPAELVIAVEEARAAGLTAWAALTAGPEGDLMTPAALAAGARAAIAAGAEAALVHCVDIARIDPYVAALAEVAPVFGVYANAGPEGGGLGWGATGDEGPRAFADAARRHRALGASIVGACCGAGPAHVAAISRALPG